MWSFLKRQNLNVAPSIQTNAVTNFDPSTIRKDAEDTHIVVHQRFPSLVKRFLEHKLVHGSVHEKALYASITWEQEVTRLTEKRPLVFMGASDHTMLRNGKMIKAPAIQWDRNGTQYQEQNSDLTLVDYLSYDEIMLSSLIGVSGPSYFINDGNRYNGGKVDAPDSFEPRGIICGLVGARFEREDRMDSIFMLPPVARPKQHPELTALFLDFFGASHTSPQQSFNEECYKARIRITADILLLEASSRAAAASDNQAQPATRTAYVYVVGLGLGVWQHQDNQAELYLAAFADSIASLPQKHRIETIEFAYIKASPQMQRLVTRATQ